MNENITIRVSSLGKSYIISHESCSKSLPSGLATVDGKTSQKVKHNSATRETFWALDDVSFEVEKGDVLGIIGRNGAGKSTLLKILSRITEPTKGYAEISGRVGSLLEVGTGFHPELTGRENVFLNATLLGMKQKDIRLLFDQIVDFAGVERFLDTPVKRYSSGMYVRLAFAIAAHINPDVLILDEVMAVGDIGFQKKCLSRIEDNAKNGTTILLVSHGMSSIRNFCNQVLYLENGKVKDFGNASNVVEHYIADAIPKDAETTAERFYPDQSEKPVVLRRVALLDANGKTTRVHSLGSQFWLEIDYEIKERLRDCMVIFAVSRDGAVVYQSHDTDLDETKLLERVPGCYRAKIPLPRRLLVGGVYSVYPAITVGFSGQYAHDGRPDALSFSITEDDEFEIIERKGYAQSRGGVVIVEPPWETERINSGCWVASL